MLSTARTGSPHIVGVRHHSPACARLVEHTIRTLRPRAVLIEGPADMNARLDELAAAHQLPIAIFSYYQREERAHASWSPFCDYSPEWVALREGRAIDAEVRFIDLPAWASAFAGVRNRYADHERPRADYVATLCDRLGVDGLDALWDHLFEQPAAPDVLSANLGAYFARLREGAGIGPVEEQRDAAREAFMAQHIAAVMDEGEGEVVVVCGGYHAPHLAAVWRDAPSTPPETPAPEEGARHGSYLVPYSFHRLDAFTGYESGMPSPAYYQAVFDEGPDRAGERMLERAVTRLRERKQTVSAADLIAADVMTRGLMRLRGHRAMARTDLLDGMAAALLKDAQETPLPWTRRGPVAPGTDPMLVEILAALSGEREGRLAPGTPRPPLTADVEALLERLELTPRAGETRHVTLDLVDAHALEKSRALHRLRVLGIPGFARVAGPSTPIDRELEERWAITRVLDADSALVEAAAWGGTLESAALAKLEELLALAGPDMSALARVLGEALFVGLGALARRTLSAVAAQVHREPHLDRLGEALALLLALYRHDTIFGAARSASSREGLASPLPRAPFERHGVTLPPQSALRAREPVDRSTSAPLAVVIQAMVARGLWLFEGATGPTAQAKAGELRALIAMRDAVKHGGPALGLDVASIAGVMERRAAEPEAPPAHRGAALGFAWSMGAFASEEEARERAVRALRGAARPEILGEMLSGLFALAREEVVRAVELVGALDAVLVAAPWHDLLVSLPSLRLAFAWFPPRERDAIARLVLSLHGQDGASLSRLRHLEVDADHLVRATELERRVDAIEARFALGPEVP